MYRVASFDLCVPGFERLRSQSEFILVAYPSVDSTAADLAAQWRDDLQSAAYSWPLDYDAARAAIDAFATECASDIERALRSVDWSEAAPDDADMGESLTAYLYVESDEPEAQG